MNYDWTILGMWGRVNQSKGIVVYQPLTLIWADKYIAAAGAGYINLFGERIDQTDFGKPSGDGIGVPHFCGNIPYLGAGNFDQTLFKQSLDCRVFEIWAAFPIHYPTCVMMISHITCGKLHLSKDEFRLDIKY